MKIPYKVEVLHEGNWIIKSYHNNYEHAEINMEVYWTGHKSPVRIVQAGVVITERGLE